jgi:hypothetical protein
VGQLLAVDGFGDDVQRGLAHGGVGVGDNDCDQVGHCSFGVGLGEGGGTQVVAEFLGCRSR